MGRCPVRLTAVLADIYSLPEHEVARWPERVQIVLHAAAAHRGWLTPEETA